MTATIDKDAAIQLAKLAAAERKYPWIEPTHVVERENDYLVSSNAEFLGGNVIVVIDRTTGGILSIDEYLR